MSNKYFIVGPPHDRDSGEPAPVEYPGHDVLAEIAAGEHGAGVLRELGLRPWDEPDANGRVLWLLPAEWYGHLPPGLETTDIHGVRGEHRGSDRRFGVLAYGFVLITEAVG